MTLKNNRYGICRVICKPGDRFAHSFTYICPMTGVERVEGTGGVKLSHYMESIEDLHPDFKVMDCADAVAAYLSQK